MKKSESCLLVTIMANEHLSSEAGDNKFNDPHQNKFTTGLICARGPMAKLSNHFFFKIVLHFLLKRDYFCFSFL